MLCSAALPKFTTRHILVNLIQNRSKLEQDIKYGEEEYACADDVCCDGVLSLLSKLTLNYTHRVLMLLSLLHDKIGDKDGGSVSIINYFVPALSWSTYDAVGNVVENLQQLLGGCQCYRR